MEYYKLATLRFDFKDEFVFINIRAVEWLDLSQGDRINVISLDDKIFICKSKDEGNLLNRHGRAKTLKFRNKSILFLLMRQYGFTNNCLIQITKTKSELNGERLFRLIIPTRNERKAARNLGDIKRIKTDAC